MIPGFGILIIFMMLIRHIGACIRENNFNAESKKRALSRPNTFGTYMTINGQDRLLSNDHPIIDGRDKYKGRWYKDLVTGEYFYPDLEKIVEEMKEQINKGCISGSVYAGSNKYASCAHKVFVDYKTGQIYAKSSYRGEFGDGKNETYFYTDLETRTKVIRKTDEQLEYERKLKEHDIQEEFYELDEIDIEKEWNNQRTDSFTNTKYWNIVSYEDHPLWRARIG